MKNLLMISTLVLVIFSTIFPKSVFAASDIVFNQSASMAALQTQQTHNDNRVQLLRGYLERYNSPLAPYANVFVEKADKYNIDWRLVVAISGVESGFGQALPANSYNGWGYGIYDGHVRYFTSWDDAIDTVSKAIRQDYMDRWEAYNVYQIGSIYAADPAWAYKVSGYMNSIDQYSLDNSVQNLPLSI